MMYIINTFCSFKTYSNPISVSASRFLLRYDCIVVFLFVLDSKYVFYDTITGAIVFFKRAITTSYTECPANKYPL